MRVRGHLAGVANTRGSQSDHLTTDNHAPMREWGSLGGVWIGEANGVIFPFVEEQVFTIIHKIFLVFFFWLLYLGSIFLHGGWLGFI
jgi:hypothetical protein